MSPEKENRPVPFEERETTINIDFEDKKAYVYSSHPKTVDYLISLTREYGDAASVDLLDASGVQVIMPMSWIRIKPPNRMSDEARARAAERLASVRRTPEAKPNQEQQMHTQPV